MPDPLSNPTLKADGFEGAVLGCAWRCGQPPVIVYDYDKCVEILMERDGMDHEEAEEWMSYNVEGAWVGLGTPIFLHRASLDEIEEIFQE